MGPAQGRARQIVIAEQQAAARIASIQTALDATRLGHHSVRGDQRAGLAAELHQLRAHHPTLAPGDPAARWETLIADAKTVDRDALAQLRFHHAQAITDLDWYRNTATQLRADADHQQATITGIRDELTTRTGHPPSPASPRPHAYRAEAPSEPGVSASAVPHSQIATAPKPPQDSPGP